MHEKKKQLELLLVNYFRDVYPGFAKGRIVSSESPDFIVRGKGGKKLGIELIRLHPTESFRTGGADDSNEIKTKLLETAKELYERSAPLKLYVKFLFSEKKQITEERLLSVSAFVASLIRKRLLNKNEQSFFVQYVTSGELPEGIEKILLIHHPKLNESVWEGAKVRGDTENLIFDLHHAIRKKEEKIQLYRKKKLDEYWLLITTDQIQASGHKNADQHISNQKFESEFQRILLFDMMKPKVFELKMPSSD